MYLLLFLSSIWFCISEMENDCQYNKSESDFPVCEWRNHNARKVTTSTACGGQWFRRNVSLLARAKLRNWNFQSTWYFFSSDCGFFLVFIDSNSEIPKYRSLITLTVSPYTWLHFVIIFLPFITKNDYIS